MKRNTAALAVLSSGLAWRVDDIAKTTGTNTESVKGRTVRYLLIRDDRGVQHVYGM
jgi:hypothetical protein